MNSRLVDYFRTVQEVHAGLYNEMKVILSSTQTMSIEELSEVAFVFKKSSELVDDVRKQLNKSQATLEMVICKKWVQASNADAPQVIETQHLSAKPVLKMMTSIPSDKTDPEAYTTLLRNLNVPEECWPLIRLHWPALCEHLTQLAIEGKPFPGGLDPRKIVPTYAVRFRQRKEITEADKALTNDDIPF